MHETISQATRYAVMKNNFQRRVLAVSGFIMAAACAPTLARATVYEAVNGFSKTANPNGPWSNLAGGVLLDQPEGQPGDSKVHYWTNGKTMPDAALVGRNFGGTVWQGATTVIYPDHLDMDPENISNVAVRFTAPLSGSYTFRGHFEGTDRNEASHPVAISINGGVIFNGTIGSFGEQVTFSGRAKLKKGDIIDFITQTNGGEVNLSTGLRVRVVSH